MCFLYGEIVSQIGSSIMFFSFLMAAMVTLTTCRGTTLVF